jgi:transcriptional regulator with XRE-family HTH domain
MVRDLPADAPTFGDLLRRHRRARELTQEALAERANVSARAISDLERAARRHPYRETARLLADALGLAGNEREALLAAARRPLPSVARAAAISARPRLPRPLTALIGRDDALHEVAKVLRGERVRLLTLTGPAGVGKTRLAIAAAERLGDAFRDGVLFIDLAPLTDPAHVVPAMAAALDLADQGAVPPEEALHRRLRARQMLLVLDNFEHLLPAAPLLADLLQTAPDVQALVTSRAPLRLHGEREFAVAPLRNPDPGARESPEALAACDAIRLFLERARAVQPDFVLTADTAPVVAAICRRLDGWTGSIDGSPC